MQEEQFLFIELKEMQTPLDSSQVVWIDALAVGMYRDMWGTKFKITQADLEKYVKNTAQALASTKDANGNLIGFPIDQRNHSHAEAAGFFNNIRLGDNGKVQLAVIWNEAGKGLIQTNTFRYFSPTFDTEEKVILGGSLVNYPAFRSQKHELQLSPVEAGLYTVAEGEGDDFIKRLANKLWALVGGNTDKEGDELETKQEFQETREEQQSMEIRNFSDVLEAEEMRGDLDAYVQAKVVEATAAVKAQAKQEALEEIQRQNKIGAIAQKLAEAQMMEKEKAIEFLDGLSDERLTEMEVMADRAAEKSTVDLSELGEAGGNNNPALPDIVLEGLNAGRLTVAQFRKEPQIFESLTGLKLSQVDLSKWEGDK